MKKYQVIEDNAGSLYLFLFDGSGNVIFAGTGYEHRSTAGTIKSDISAFLADDFDLNDWDHDEEFYDACGGTAQGVYDHITGFDRCGWMIIADQGGIYPDDMGAAGKIEFGIDVLF